MSERLAVKRTVFAFRNGNIAEVYQAPSRDARSSCGILSTSQRQTRIHRFHEYTEASSLKASQLRGYPSFVQTVWSRFSIDAHRVRLARISSGEKSRSTQLSSHLQSRQ